MPSLTSTTHGMILMPLFLTRYFPFPGESHSIGLIDAFQQGCCGCGSVPRFRELPEARGGGYCRGIFITKSSPGVPKTITLPSLYRKPAAPSPRPRRWKRSFAPQLKPMSSARGCVEWDSMHRKEYRPSPFFNLPPLIFLNRLLPPTGYQAPHAG